VSEAAKNVAGLGSIKYMRPSPSSSPSPSPCRPSHRDWFFACARDCCGLSGAQYNTVCVRHCDRHTANSMHQTTGRRGYRETAVSPVTTTSQLTTTTSPLTTTTHHPGSAETEHGSGAPRAVIYPGVEERLERDYEER
jgi:hypothetical protein